MWARSCDDSPIADRAHRTLDMKLRDVHLESRKDWCAYVNLSTMVHRQVAAQANEFIAQLWARLEQPKRP